MNITTPLDKCTKCGGPLYDNRQSKLSPKSPDFKCKDQSCGEAYWLKSAARVSASTRGGGSGYQRTAKWESWITLQAAYWRCLNIAKSQILKALPNAEPSDIIAGAATLFIAVGRDGVKEPQPAVKPQPLDEKPKAVAEVQAEGEDFSWDTGDDR